MITYNYCSAIVSDVDWLGLAVILQYTVLCALFRNTEWVNQYLPLENLHGKVL